MTDGEMNLVDDGYKDPHFIYLSLYSETIIIQK